MTKKIREAVRSDILNVVMSDRTEEISLLFVLDDGPEAEIFRLVMGM